MLFKLILQERGGGEGAEGRRGGREAEAGAGTPAKTTARTEQTAAARVSTKLIITEASSKSKYQTRSHSSCGMEQEYVPNS